MRVSRSQFSVLTLALGLVFGSELGAQEQALLSDPNAEALFESMPLVLTASRMAQSALDAPASIFVIDREMIEASGFTEIHDLLRLVPGYLVTDWPDGQPSVANHGLGDAYGNRLKVMLDGTAINNPLRGDVLWTDLPLRVDDIQRIEVIRGPNGAAYGAGAFQGVVNIITRSPLTESGVSFMGRAAAEGKYDDAQLRVSSGSDEQLSWRISASRRQIQTFESYNNQSMEQIERGVVNAFATLHVNDTDELSAQLGLTDGDDTRGYPAGRFAPIHGESVQERFLKLAWQRSFNAESELSIKYSHQGHETNGQWSARVAGNPMVYIDFDTTRDALELQYFDRITPELKYLLGAELSQESAQSPRFFSSDETYRDQNAQIFGNLDWSPWTDLSFNLGGNLEYNSYSGELFSPRLAMNYKIDPHSSVRLSTGQAYRRPSMLEAYANESLIFNGQVIDTGLRSLSQVVPERVRHVDAAYLIQIPELKLDVDVRVFLEKYDRFVDDETCYFTGSGAIFQPCPFPPPSSFPPVGSSVDYLLNQGSVSTRGVEGRFDWRQSWGRVLGSLSLVNIFNVDNVTDVDAIKSAPEAAGNVLLIKYLPERWRFSLGYYYQGSMKWLNDGDLVKPRNLWNAKLSKSFGAPGSESEFAITALSMSGDYPDFNEAKFRQESMVFASVRLGF
jgi:iron complex outermembrane receptor protein